MGWTSERATEARVCSSAWHGMAWPGKSAACLLYPLVRLTVHLFVWLSPALVRRRCAKTTSQPTPTPTPTPSPCPPLSPPLSFPYYLFSLNLCHFTTNTSNQPPGRHIQHPPRAPLALLWRLLDLHPVQRRPNILLHVAVRAGVAQHEGQGSEKKDDCRTEEEGCKMMRG
ncbi:uncharacterized protein J3D65DRAFT_629283 [Phyllosticta citribraziliensis]|uniref:Uncharacterized protein n=1 Tax=Phyllosticta citribraziliensis TaxID=989973 RepID=A0ABR1LI25_9PEZI